MVWWKNPCFLCFYVWEIFIKEENLHSFTTPRVCPTKAICWPSWYKSLHICTLLLQWASSNFVTLVRCPFILVWSRSCALHQLNFYIGSQLCHSIHLQNKTPCLMISLSFIRITWGHGYVIVYLFFFLDLHVSIFFFFFFGHASWACHLFSLFFFE